MKVIQSFSCLDPHIIYNFTIKLPQFIQKFLEFITCVCHGTPHPPSSHVVACCFHRTPRRSPQRHHSANMPSGSWTVSAMQHGLGPGGVGKAHTPTWGQLMVRLVGLGPGGLGFESGVHPRFPIPFIRGFQESKPPIKFVPIFSQILPYPPHPRLGDLNSCVCKLHLQTYMCKCV